MLKGRSVSHTYVSNLLSTHYIKENVLETGEALSQAYSKLTLIVH